MFTNGKVMQLCSFESTVSGIAPTTCAQWKKSIVVAHLAGLEINFWTTSSSCTSGTWGSPDTGITVLSAMKGVQP
jgi:hypothetical protein